MSFFDKLKEKKENKYYEDIERKYNDLVKRYRPKNNDEREKVYEIARKFIDGEYERNGEIKRKILAGAVGLSCIVLGVTGYKLSQDRSDDNTKNSDKIIGEKESGIKKEGLKANKEIKEERENTVKEDSTDTKELSEDENVKIKSIYDAKDWKDCFEYFKEIYLRDYNEKNGTNYKPDDVMMFTKNYAEYYVLKDDNNVEYIVSRSSNVQALRDKLKNVEHEEEYNQPLYSMVLGKSVDTSGAPNTNETRFLETVGFTKNGVVNVIPGDVYLLDKEYKTTSSGDTLKNMALLMDEIIDYKLSSEGKASYNTTLKNIINTAEIHAYAYYDKEKSAEVAKRRENEKIAYNALGKLDLAEDTVDKNTLVGRKITKRNLNNHIENSDNEKGIEI